MKLKHISIIVPVKDNQSGIDRFLKTFFETHVSEHYPKEVIIVDNNSSVPIIILDRFKEQELDILLFTCVKPGPAAARNKGAKHASGKWLLFVDSDCIPTKTMISGYLGLESSAVGYQGFVGALSSDYLSNYYVSQKIHQPLYIIDAKGAQAPKYLISANIMIKKKSFDLIDGFSEAFTFAGGEDIDLALRLKQIGKLALAPDSLVNHYFNDGLNGFIKRFIRYGKGNRQLQFFHNINFLPLPSSAKKKSIFANNFLVILQWICLLIGYMKMHQSIKKNS